MVSKRTSRQYKIAVGLETSLLEPFTTRHLMRLIGEPMGLSGGKGMEEMTFRGPCSPRTLSHGGH